MTTKDPSRWPAAPRIADDLDDRPEPLEEGASWSGVAAGSDAPPPGTASECEIVGSTLTGMRLTGAALDESRFVDVVFDGCEMSSTALDGSTLVRVLFQRCRMSGLTATALKAEDVRFVDCKLDGANFRGTKFERCAFTTATWPAPTSTVPRSARQDCAAAD
jgi:uncharacterized protein YjbI with pentapeptide repeats